LLSDHALTHALERAGLHAPVRFEEVTRSTQATALALAADGAPEWTLVAAGHQTRGRGRLGRAWSDRAGRALLLSVVLRPDLDPARGGLLTLAAGLALASAVDRVGGGDAACKWPNDLLVGGRKAGGILAESRVAGGRFEHVVLGIGVNLGAPPEDVPGAGSVTASDEELLGAFLEALVAAYRPADPDWGRAVLDAYRDRCATIGTPVRATSTDGTAIDGTAVGVGDDGDLLVRTADGVRSVAFGTVEHLE
jgi:BirA family biotin operon repressor/biotin-[acetyl-CoA-carboxylase] ligase